MENKIAGEYLQFSGSFKAGQKRFPRLLKFPLSFVLFASALQRLGQREVHITPVGPKCQRFPVLDDGAVVVALAGRQAAEDERTNIVFGLQTQGLPVFGDRVAVVAFRSRASARLAWKAALSGLSASALR